MRFMISISILLYLNLGDVGSGIQLPILHLVLLLAPRMKSLGVILDVSFSAESQVTTTARWPFYHLCLIRQLVSYLASHNLATMSHMSHNTSSLDHCNSLYMGLHLNLIQKLNLVQNVAVCMPTALSLQVRIKPVLGQSFWLTIEYWIHFKDMVGAYL